MNRVAVAAVLAGGLLAAGCSGGGGVTRKAGAATERHPDGPVRELTAARSEPVSGKPGGMATDRDGTVVEVDDRTVVAYDASGVEGWSSSVPGAALGRPLLGNGLVVIPTVTAGQLGESSKPSHSGADDSGGCVALDRATGARRWSYEEDGKSGVAVATAGTRVFCVFVQGVIAAVDRDTGKLLWRVMVDTRVAPATMAVAERAAIAIDPATGTLSFTMEWGGRWMLITRDLSTGEGTGGFPFRSGPVSSPVLVSAGLLGVGSTNEACWIDLRTSKIACTAVHAPDGFDPSSVPAVAEGALVVAASDGSVTAVDVAKRTVRWGKLVPTPIFDTDLAITEGVVVFADWTRVPWALRMSDGSKIDIPGVDGFVSSTASDPAGGFIVAIRSQIDGSVDRWVPQR